MKNFKLNDCLFCGSTNVKLHRNFDYVYCKDCGARGSYFDGHPEDAVNVWNKINTGYGGEITDTNWHHIALVKKVDEYGIYKDGTQGMQRG